jgi:two-component system, chemotaxis family, CheB/CheR fusion protein
VKTKRSKKNREHDEKSSKAPATNASPNEKQQHNLVVVAIGASAGGLEAFTELLSHLPSDTGMAFVLVQHLDPKHESMLTELISRSTRMPVLEVKNGMVIEPDHVYVIPPNRTMTIHDHTLQLTAREETRGQHMAVDYFMRALAQAQGHNAIGVILSGSGTDGTLGLAEIQAQGGVTFAQDETTARHDGMPRSAIAAGCVDFVLPPAEIARELTRIASHPYIGRGGKEPGADLVPEQHVGLNTIFQMIRKSTGVDFTHYRHTTIRRRVQRRMIVHKFDTLPRYIKYLQQNPAELKALYQDMLINVTSFFRNPSVFEALKTRVFPAIMKNHSTNSPIRIWAPGCSTGEETYSVAIALLEFLGDRASTLPLQIFGSDVSENNINKARNGLYTENIQGDVSLERLRRFFVKVDGGYRINKNVRDMCIFAQQNVLIDPPFSQMDLICCRNLLIYLEAPLQKNVVSLFHYALRPDGFLVLGTAESVGTLSNLFSLEDRASKIYSKRSTAMRPPVTFSLGRYPERAEPGTKPYLVTKKEPSWNAAEAQKEFDRRLLQQFAPAAVFVDEGLEVVHSRGNVDRYLKLSPGRATLSILKMAREGLLLELRNAITRAKKENVTVRQEHVEVKSDHTIRNVTVEVVPLHVANTREPYLMVVFEEADAKSEKRPGKGRVVPLRKDTPPKRVAKLEQELASTTEYLHTLIENQEATNEELQSANEEILSSNEELQSTNEELETAKEELQSTNEELSTVNDELRNRNLEITQANNDLLNLLASIDVAVIMLGSDLKIRRFTPEAQKILGLISADVGRPFEDINGGLNIPNLHDLIVKLVSDLIPFEREVRVRSGKSYIVRAAPYRTGENKIEGAVITFIGLPKVLLEGKQAEDTPPGEAAEFMLVLDPELRVKAATPSFYRAFRLNPEAVQNRPLHEHNHFVSDNPELQKALQKVRQTGQPIAPFTVELKDRGARRKFECRLEPITLEGGAKVITLSLRASSGQERSA